MGVPALFRWLSKKYAKIILPVIEEEETKVPDADGNDVAIPIDISRPNPNDMEFDNLYLDMNNIVHPCTHPEGKPAPETEEEMMLEVFKYTERLVNMIRPRKLLFMAIDGVAPRAKMNQQRSRRFRSSQEAKDKAEARKEAEAIWESMGKVVTEEEKNKKAWDSNAITPGTPFMDFLAASLRYWVAHKMNTDPGWKQMQVIISDANVPGEGEHKIMGFIRRQRTNPGHDPNTRHVIYGLDADLIMLALATHEPYFRVLREDVFFQEGSRTACRICGQEGHYAAQCTGEKAEVKQTPPEQKPYIFLDVSILREYLEAELNVPQTPFPFNLEQAIDDWVLLIFFVGNDFLPHLPSLEIREGAIDTLLKIWRDELPRMGGYLTNHGRLELSRAQIILEGLARREDDIFRRRREAEERQDQNAKRRKLEKDGVPSILTAGGPAASLNLTALPSAPNPFAQSTPHPLPARPQSAAKADSIGQGGPKTAEALQHAPIAAQALAGSNRDVVANRFAIRMANMSAAEMLKAELAGAIPLKPSASSKTAAPVVPALPPAPVAAPVEAVPEAAVDNFLVEAATMFNSETSPEVDMDAEGEPDPDATSANGDADVRMNGDSDGPRGTKRSIDATEDDEDTAEDDEPPPDVADTLSFKVNADGTVEQEDTVKLWEPGYKERYYRQKFGVEYSDVKFRNSVAKHYVEGLAWVLQYYYDGTPSWQWYYPHHFAPFAADFVDVDKLDIQFSVGQPFKPFEQLMGVFPAASRHLIPEVFHNLMTDEHSPIIDFYPPSFQIDMNGKRMAWQGVALLPFIDEKRLLDAMGPHYPDLSDEEKRRNKWGNNVLYVFEEHSLYPSLEALYGKRKKDEVCSGDDTLMVVSLVPRQPMPMDVKASKGISGSLLPNPDCIPGSNYYSPLPSTHLPDIKSDRTLSAFYLYPKQLTPHRSVLLPGVRRPRPVLTEADRESTRRGGRGRGRGDNGSFRGSRGNSYGGPPSYNSHPYNNGRDHGGRGGNEWHNGRGHHPPSFQQQPSYPQQPSFQQYGNNGGQYGGGSSYGVPRGRGAPRGGRGSYNNGSYAGGQGGYNSGNSRGSYSGGNAGGGGYGGYGGGGYGGGGGGYGGPPQNGYAESYGSGSYGNSRGGAYNARGRGRGGRY
ncbi:exoribonuclease 2 [Amylocystis lapponica]|nr:exoribonuclease 2 [Amylocystis lapponica]